MITQWIQRLTVSREPSEEPIDQDIQRVSAVLLVEIARADHAIEPAERSAIAAALQQAFALETAEIDSLFDEANAEADSNVSLHAHVQLVNSGFSHAEKIRLVEQMWRVAIADGDIDKYEEYTIRKLCDLLYLKHRDYMQAKLRVLESPDS